MGQPAGHHRGVVPALPQLVDARDGGGIGARGRGARGGSGSRVGKRDQRLGEVLVAFVVLDAGASLTQEEFFEYCKTEMVKYKRPVEVHFVESLPKTGTNKINRLALRERV